VLATRFITPRLPGEDTAFVQTSVTGVDYGGEVLAIKTADMTQLGTTILKHSEEPDTSNSASGIPNYLGAAVISPDGTAAWVPSKQDNIKRGALRKVGSTLTHDMAIRSIASRIALPGRTEVLDDRIDFDNTGLASAVAFDPNGVFFYVALESSREIAVADAWAKNEILRFDAGRAPQGLVLSPDGRTLFVHNFMDRSVTVHDLSALANGTQAAPPAAVVLNCVTTEKLTPEVLLGKQLFYDARDTRVAFQQYISCATCHNDGGQDGRVWDFKQFGEGLRNTITLRGHGGTAQGPLHWTGNFDEVQDFEGQIRGFARGTGLMSDADFHAGTRSQPLGDPKAGRSDDLDALAAYVTSLATNGDSPHRRNDGGMTAAARAGQAIFNQQNCAQCHTGTQFTDSALNVFRDVGTLNPTTSGQRLGAPLTGLDTPTLLGLWNTAPFLHDGSAATLEAAVAAHNGVSLAAQEMSDLVAFLKELDDAGIAPEPSTITWGGPAAITYGSALGTTQLNATADVPGTFSYSCLLYTSPSPRDH
jgi:cytochrome c peroxidase